MAADNRATNARNADDEDVVESGTASQLPTAVVVPPKGDAPPIPADPTRWVRRGIFLGALVIGWLFILWQNRFYFSPPTVFVCLAYLAVVSTGYALWRTGVVVVEDTDEADSTWGRPLGRRTELDREKKTLLKAIKEAEFDREMGKLSKADAEEMIAVYRVRAIEVIKEIDQMDAGTAGTVREQIERELKARLEIETKTTKLKADAQADASKDKKKKEALKKGAKPTSKEPAQTAVDAATDAESKADASKADVAKADASKNDASKNDDATANPSKADASKSDASKNDASKNDTATADNTKADGSNDTATAADNAKAGASSDVATAAELSSKTEDSSKEATS